MINIAFFSPGVYCIFFNELIDYAKKNKFCIENDEVNWFVLTNTNIYLSHLEKNICKKNICYLFENFNEYMSDENFTYDLDSYCGSLYRDILTDKHAYFTKLSSYQMKNVSVIYKIWKEYLINNDIDYIIFPDIEFVEGMILLALCKELNIKVLYYVNARSIGGSFFAKNINEEYYKSTATNNDGASDFISKIKNSNKKAYEVTLEFNQAEYDHKISKYGRTSLEKLISFLKNKFIYEKHYLKEDMSFTVRFRMRFLGLLNKYRRSRKYIYEKYVTVKTIEMLPKKFIYFPLQVTPESSINNLEPYFVDQLRAIDLLLMNITPDIKVVVKEHPIFAGERSEKFYKILSCKPGVEISSLAISSSDLIDSSIMVCSVTGTALLEAMLRNKPVFQFGKTFFYQDQFGFDSFRSMASDLRAIINNDRENNIDLVIADLYSVLFDFYIEQPAQYYYQPRPVALMDSNLDNTLKAISFYIKGISKGELI